MRQAAVRDSAGLCPPRACSPEVVGGAGRAGRQAGSRWWGCQRSTLGGKGEGAGGQLGGGFTFVLRLEVEMVCHRREVRP